MLKTRGAISRYQCCRLASCTSGLTWRSISNTVQGKYTLSPESYIPPRKTHYKTIVVGGGHNGLVAAAYLAKSGTVTKVFNRGFVFSCRSYHWTCSYTAILEYKRMNALVQWTLRLFSVDQSSCFVLNSAFTSSEKSDSDFYDLAVVSCEIFYDA